MKGKFIVIEGIDGAGSTTQGRLLVDRLRSEGYHSLLTAEPTDGPIGVLIREILKKRVVFRLPSGEIQAFPQEELALLFAADRVDHCKSEIIPLLKKNWWVVSDRYLYSSLAYQGISVPQQWLTKINFYACKPDLTIFIDVPVKVAMDRVSRSRASKEIFEKEKVLKIVRANYLKILSTLNQEELLVVNGTRPKEEVHEEIFKNVLDLLS